MASAKVKFKIKESALKDLRQAIAEETGRRMRNNFGDLRPLIEDSIDGEIDRNSDRFIPNSREAAELGVGSDGQIAVEKTETAWRALQVRSGQGVTTFSSRKAGSKASNVIGSITIDIDKEAFYSAPASVIDTPDSDAISRIPWMKWFIEGASLSEEGLPNARFSSRRPIPETSRTGGGIMIEGGLWDFQPRSVLLIEQMLDRIRIRIGRDLRAEGAVILRK